MAGTQNEYRKLPGRGYAGDGPVAVSRVLSRLYLGKDHLLRVNSSWVEKYRRFYYNDIQAIIVNRTRTGLVWTIVLAILCAGLLYWCLMIHDSVGRIIVGSIAGFFGLFLIINALLGATCKVRIVTGTGTEPLYSLKRLRTARKALARLKPEILAAQGEVQQGELAGKLADLQAAPATSKRSPGARKPNNYRGALHVWLFAGLVLEAVMIGAFISVQGALTGMVLAATVLFTAASTFVALARQSSSVLGSGLRSVTWWAAALAAVTLFAGYCLMVFSVIRNPKLANDQYAMVSALARLPIMKTPWLLELLSFVAAFAAILGLVGLIIWFNSRAAIANAVATGAEPS